MTAPAVVTTTGTTSLEQQLATFRGSIPVGGSGLPGVFTATANGVIGDGATDDAPALSTLANTTMAGSGTIYLTPGKVYRLATAITIPAGVTLWVPQGTTLKADGVTITVQGPILAGLWQIFAYANGGSVVFSTTNFAAGLGRVSGCPVIRPEWWGAKGDNAHDDTTAIQETVDATTGYPLSGLISTRYAGPPIELSGIYRLTHAIQITDVIGLRISGGNQSNTQLVFDAGETGTATSGTTTTLVNSVKVWATNKWGDGTWWVTIYGGTGAGQSVEIASNTGTTLTFASALGTAPDATSQYVIEARGVLLLNGVFTSQFDHFQITGTNGYWKHGVVYYREPATSVRGSSQCRFTNVSVLLGYTDSGWQFGGGKDLASDAGFQADLCTLVGCQAFGLGAASGLYGAQIGFRFGDGLFANPLNYTAIGCESVANQYNVLVAATNVSWYGGTIQTATGADILINNGVQGYSVFDGFRSEGSRMLLDSVSPQSVAWNVTIRNVDFALDAYHGNRWVSWRCGSGNLSLENVRTIAPPLITGTASAGTATTLADSTKAFDTATRTYIDGQTAVGLAGWDIRIVAGTGNGQRRVITSNTATAITVPAWTVTPDATSQYQIMPRTPIVTEPLGISRLKLTNLLLTGTPIDQAVQTGPAGGTWSATLEGYGELDGNGTLIMGAGVMQNGVVYLSSGKNVAPYVGWAAPAGGQVDTFLYRMAAGIVGAASIGAGSLAVSAIGTTPAANAVGVLTVGTTTYNYKLVARDGAGNPALPSATFSVTNAAATLSPTAAVLISYPGAAVPSPAASFDILKDDGTGTFKLLLNVPWWELQAFYDVGQPLTAYTLPTSDATGTLSHSGGKLGFYGATPATQPTVTGAKGSNAALGSLITQLAALGLIVDGSSA